MILSVMLGLFAALCWGIGDLLAKVYAPAWGGGRPWVLWSQAVGALGYGVFFMIVRPDIPTLSLQWVGLLAILGLIGLGGYLAFFTAVEKGNLSIVSPIAASWAGVAFLLSAWLLPDVLPLSSWGFLLMVFSGVILLSVPQVQSAFSPAKRFSGIIPAMLAVLFWGVFNFFVKFAGDAAGPYVPVLAVKVWGTVFLVGRMSIARTRIIPFLRPSPPGNSRQEKRWPFVLALIAASLLDMIAYYAYVIGAMRGTVPVVAAFASLFSLFAALLGIAFLKERLIRLQWVGVALVVVGSFALFLYGD